MDRRIKLRVLSAAKVDPNFSVVDDEIRDYKNHVAYNAETDEYYITGILDGMIGVPECMTGIVGLMGNYRRIDTKALERLMSSVENYKTIATKNDGRNRGDMTPKEPLTPREALEHAKREQEAYTLKAQDRLFYKDFADFWDIVVEALEKPDAVDVLLHFFPDEPCNYNSMDYKTDEWCAEHCGEHTARACWEHAIKERWYE